MHFLCCAILRSQNNRCFHSCSFFRCARKHSIFCQFQSIRQFAACSQLELHRFQIRKIFEIRSQIQRHFLLTSQLNGIDFRKFDFDWYSLYSHFCVASQYIIGFFNLLSIHKILIRIRFIRRSFQRNCIPCIVVSFVGSCIFAKTFIINPFKLHHYFGLLIQSRVFFSSKVLSKVLIKSTSRLVAIHQIGHFTAGKLFRCFAFYVFRNRRRFVLSNRILIAYVAIIVTIFDLPCIKITNIVIYISTADLPNMITIFNATRGTIVITDATCIVFFVIFINNGAIRHHSNIAVIIAIFHAACIHVAYTSY